MTPAIPGTKALSETVDRLMNEARISHYLNRLPKFTFRLEGEFEYANPSTPLKYYMGCDWGFIKPFHGDA